MEEYRTYTLDEISKGKGCYGIAASAVPFDSSLYTYLRITDINDDGSLNKSGLTSVDEDNAGNYLLKPNDIVFARTGNSTGRAYFYDGSDGELVYAGFLIKFSLDESKVNPRIMKYYTHSKPYYDWVRSFDTGGTRGNINAKTYGNMPITLPSRTTQDSVVAILKSLDDKIEVNRKINENLEQQAQALFKSWFVDFEPFKNGEFVESELGMIPKGWRVGQIKDIPHTLNTGKRPKGGAITSGVPSIGAEQLKGLCNYDYAKTKYISKEYSQSIPKGKVIGYEVYLNRVGGKPGDYIQNTTMFGEGYPFENCYLNDHVFKLDFMQNRGYNVFIYFTFLTTRIQKYLNACGGKAAIPVINKQNIDDIYVFLPENEYVIKFGESVLPMINMIFKIGVESARLSTLRDTLLPKLMSGELNVFDKPNDQS